MGKWELAAACQVRLNSRAYLVANAKWRTEIVPPPARDRRIPDNAALDEVDPEQSKRTRRNPYGGLPLSLVRVRCDQLSLAPCRIQVRILPRSQLDNCFLPCGMRKVGDARQSSNSIKLLLSGSRGTIMGPNFVPFITPA